MGNSVLEPWKPGSEALLEAQVRGLEAQAFVEAVGVGAGDVGGQLYEHAALAAGLLDGPFDELRPETAAALVGVDADALDDRAGGAPAGETRDDRQLEGADDLGPRTATTTCW